MRLTPKETDRLLVFAAAELARKRRARGRLLNVTEATALIADEMFELAWDGVPLSEVRERACGVLGTADVMPGVAALVTHVEVDCLFPSGSALVSVDRPIRSGKMGPAEVAVPAAQPAAAEASSPGAVSSPPGTISLAAARRRVNVTVVNTSDRTVTVSSHFPFADVSQALRFDRRLASGMRLDVPAGSSVLFLPGASREVGLVALGGSGDMRAGAGSASIHRHPAADSAASSSRGDWQMEEAADDPDRP